MPLPILSKCLREIERAAKKAPGKELLSQLRKDMTTILDIISKRLEEMK